MIDDNYIKVSGLFERMPDYLSELFSACRYPWEILPSIKALAAKLASDGIDGYRLIRDGVITGENVKIADSAVIEGPCVIGGGTEIRPGAFIRGSVIIGDDCVIGNSTELKNCILLNHVQVPHYNYIGDSVLGNGAHMGAGSICSNLKSDKSDVVVHGEIDYITGLRKFGAILGDGADIGCGAVLNPGTVVCRNSCVYPLTSVRGVVMPDSIMKSYSITVKREKKICAE